MSRDELSTTARAELDALDRVLAQQRVAEEHLELAALVDSVRAGAPQMRPEFRERLDAEVHGRLAGTRPRRVPIPRMRVAALGGGFVTAAVALAIVLSSGVLGGAGGSTGTTVHGLGLGPASGAAKQLHAGAKPGGATAPAPTTNFRTASPAGRLVHRGSTLVLGAPAARIQAVANQIVTRTEQRGGVVASSNVSVAGQGGAARFSLQIPTARLGSLIGALSSLASVQSLTQATRDVTDGYDAIGARLADHRAEAASLRTQLAAATSSATAGAIRKQLGAVERRIAAESRALASLRGQARTASLRVTVEAIAPVAHHRHSGAAGPLAGSFHDALRVLVEMLAVALVVLAIAVPVAVTGLAVGWTATTLRQRSRERAIRAA